MWYNLDTVVRARSKRSCKGLLATCIYIINLRVLKVGYHALCTVSISQRTINYKKV